MDLTERGITIKAKSIRRHYTAKEQKYLSTETGLILRATLIFSYEVSRARLPAKRPARVDAEPGR